MLSQENMHQPEIFSENSLDIPVVATQKDNEKVDT
jgi:hypothetical protein